MPPLPNQHVQSLKLAMKKTLPRTGHMFENPVKNCENPGDGLELGVAGDVGLDEQFNHRATSKEQMRNQIQAETFRL